ncbi:MarR family transcriptional regulator [Bosea sp. F3-2]|uniref:MarR family winged helix-turn-helix transcriptional regulator n=1 Tax=Bosea sp. F3-2 TaxID=2599640 RepID=UPI001AEDBFB8|nr:MarR family transcriptional regulator [Bosea sp. F3-2]
MSQDRPGVQGGAMDSILAQWRRERPDLDTSVMAVCGDLWRAADRVRDGVSANLAADELDLAGFDVLLTLRRQGEGRALSPSELAQDMMISTSAMTNRLDRLQKRGLIERQADPEDRRALRIVLTATGFALADRIVVSHVATEERLVSALSPDERAQLRQLLAKIG